VKLGILSDTHKKAGRARRAIDILLTNGAEYLIHAGDVGKEETLAYMEASGVPYAAVLGNNDAALKALTSRYHLYTEPHYFAIGRLRVKLMHHPLYLTPDADLIVCGHLHRFRAVVREGALFLNPGEVCARNKPVSEAVLLEVTPKTWVVHHYERVIKEKRWQDKSILLPRSERVG